MSSFAPTMGSLKWPHVLHLADVRGQNQEVSPPSIPRPTDSDAWGLEQSVWLAGLSCVQDPPGADRVQCPLPLPHSTWPHRNIWTLSLSLCLCLSVFLLSLSLSKITWWVSFLVTKESVTLKRICEWACFTIQAAHCVMGTTVVFIGILGYSPKFTDS